MLTADAAAEYLGIPIGAFWTNVEEGRITAYRLGVHGGAIRFDRNELDRRKADGTLLVARARRPGRGGRRGPQPQPWARRSTGRLYITSNGRQMLHDKYLKEVGARVEDIARPDDRIPVGWVYFAEAADVSRVKIGHSEKHPSARLASIQATAPVTIAAIGIMRGTASVERLIHGRFESLRWNREWFQDDPSLRSFISSFASPIAAADGVHDLSMTVDEEESHYRDTSARIEAWFRQ